MFLSSQNFYFLPSNSSSLSLMTQSNRKIKQKHLESENQKIFYCDQLIDLKFRSKYYRYDDERAHLIE